MGPTWGKWNSRDAEWSSKFFELFLCSSNTISILRESFLVLFHQIWTFHPNLSYVQLLLLEDYQELWIAYKDALWRQLFLHFAESKNNILHSTIHNKVFIAD